ncbi:MAG: hypothetical protein R2911_37465 [Caldilineaceae bacterium]
MAGDNEATSGAGIYFADDNNTEDSWLHHVTLADANGNPGQAVFVVKGNIEIKNSIIANHAAIKAPCRKPLKRTITFSLTIQPTRAARWRLAATA